MLVDVTELVCVAVNVGVCEYVNMFVVVVDGDEVAVKVPDSVEVTVAV